MGPKEKKKSRNISQSTDGETIENWTSTITYSILFFWEITANNDSETIWQVDKNLADCLLALVYQLGLRFFAPNFFFFGQLTALPLGFLCNQSRKKRYLEVESCPSYGRTCSREEEAKKKPNNKPRRYSFTAYWKWRCGWKRPKSTNSHWASSLKDAPSERRND